MKLFLLLFFAGGLALQAGELRVENKFITWSGQYAAGKLTPVQVTDRRSHATFPLAGECFALKLGDDTLLRASDFQLAGPPQILPLPAEPDSPTTARQESGQQLVAKFTAPDRHLEAECRVLLRRGSDYVREELRLRARGGDVLVRDVVLFDQIVPGAKTIGTVEGSPVVAGTFFLGYEHPMAENTVDAAQQVRCAFERNAVLRDGETLTQSFVVGHTPAGQLRRGFLAYVERERAHPYRPFLHYNSWYDIAWATRKFNEAESVAAINAFGHELVEKRGVTLSSFLFDDGWDDEKTLWKFHSGFPHGFTPLQEAAAQYHTAIGVWLSPFGGYASARAARLKYAEQFGFETNSSGFSLAGPKYYQRFHDICLEMVQKYGVNQFKFDGLAAGAKAGASGLTRDGDAMLRLVADLRAAKPDIYINQTTGTWPSPFWLLYVDSTWRGGYDHSFLGKGTYRQQWMTYRDADTYEHVVQRGPLYPLNSLMLHGIIYATNAEHLATTSDADFADEVHSYFGTGTQLQEMYISPGLLNQRNWDDLAEAAKWSRAHAAVLVDTHWVGGDPAKNQVYGWASWKPGTGILVLRNPNDQPATLTASLQELWQLPAGAKKTWRLHSPWHSDRDTPTLKLAAAAPHTFVLKPFEVLVLESQ
ncbi:MAG TPA: enterotoxin [Dongiaceae bacterium]|nr:enterotoxin [Dongiaceae bacterium]